MRNLVKALSHSFIILLVFLTIGCSRASDPSLMSSYNTELSLDKNEITLQGLNKTATLNVNFVPAENAFEVTWSVTNPSVITVNQRGVVESLGYGTANVLCSASHDPSTNVSCSIIVAQESLLTPPNLEGSYDHFSDLVQIKWQSITSANGYLVYKSTTVTGPYELEARVTNNLEYTSPTVANVKQYYKIQAYNENERSELSTSVVTRAKDALATPNRPTLALSTTTTLKLSTEAIQNADGYEFSIGTDPNAENVTNKVTSLPTVLFNSLESNTQYYIKVRAYEDNSWGGIVLRQYTEYSRPIRVETLENTTLDAPTNIAASSGHFSQSIYITWDDVREAEGYKVYSSTTADGEFEYAGETEESVIALSVPSNQTRYYKVKAYGSKTDGTLSSVIEGSTKIGLAIPNKIELREKEQNSLQFSFAAIPNAEGYHATLGTDLNASNHSEQTNSEPVLAFNSLDANTTYYCKVRSYEDNTWGEYTKREYSNFSRVIRATTRP